jgi:GT2 family glycosyltransferase
MLPVVSIVIVNWNGAHHLRACLPSLRSQTYSEIEILVIDNGSTDDSFAVTEEFRAQWIPMGKNIGLAPALNVGAKSSRGDFLLFINNDMRFHENFVSSLLNPLLEDECLFATDARQYNWLGTQEVHLATRLAKEYPNIEGVVTIFPGLYLFPEGSSTNVEVFMGSAACMMTRKSAFDSLRGYDERLPLGYEDLEICWRAGILGWKVLYVPTAICWHHVGASGRSSEGSRMNFRGILKGKLLVSMKLLPIRYSLLTWGHAGAGLLKDLAGLRWNKIRDRLVVMWQLTPEIHNLLRERRTLFGNAKLTPGTRLNYFLQLTKWNYQKANNNKS